ncbi:MAG: prepilin-type N-terminal cleavage/methylation domain-containing protein [Candidatus Omnitrophica bacterium]|nr:prepilin-type N-terminal cleavage/methylation domain-containing protein [Candidatus Omnitrophota bacterium]
MLKRRGFTLIELLIVIAIILILIAIALPNFLEAQLRARITKARGDMRTISIAFESYFIDFGNYPDDNDSDDYSESGIYQLTTPIQYLTAIPIDPFVPENSSFSNQGDEYGWEITTTGGSALIAHLHPTERDSNVHAYVITSHGVDTDDDFSCGSGDWPFCGRSLSACPGSGYRNYAPTNGSKSDGDLTLPGGEYRSGRYCVDSTLIVGRYPKHIP